MLIGGINPICSQQLKATGSDQQLHVVEVLPSADTLPANLLRMYVRFSKPMKPVGNLEKIHLISEEGNEVPGAIFNNVHELWNREQTRLTILLDPSRVKTGLLSHDERGRALVQGRRYELVIDALTDVDDHMTAPFTKSFYVTEEDFSSPDSDLWHIKMPRAGSQTPLVIQFPAMLDQLSLLQRLKLTDQENRPVAGKVEIAHQETAWRFYPATDWKQGGYILYVHSRLEDPSGNNLNGLFDHKAGSLRNDSEDTIESMIITIPE